MNKLRDALEYAIVIVCNSQADVSVDAVEYDEARKKFLDEAHQALDADDAIIEAARHVVNSSGVVQGMAINDLRKALGEYPFGAAIVK